MSWDWNSGGSEEGSGSSYGLRDVDPSEGSRHSREEASGSDDDYDLHEDEAEATEKDVCEKWDTYGQQQTVEEFFEPLMGPTCLSPVHLIVAYVGAGTCSDCFVAIPKMLPNLPDGVAFKVSLSEYRHFFVKRKRDCVALSLMNGVDPGYSMHELWEEYTKVPVMAFIRSLVHAVPITNLMRLRWRGWTSSRNVPTRQRSHHSCRQNPEIHEMGHNWWEETSPEVKEFNRFLLTGALTAHITQLSASKEVKPHDPKPVGLPLPEEAP
ncbi:Hypothetical protein POVN_LOCUS281 [uncultured virus]|nr:Hypothetical protein POVN_LOCUS281 [uncultured virus]